jgi:hypothetical protein
MDSLCIDISTLIAATQEQLLTQAPHVIEYSDKEELKANRLPSNLKASAINIYALWKRDNSGADWRLMYIGQRSFKSGWSRVEQHLFSTPRGTQSKLAEVRSAIESGAQIGVTAVRVEPDSMRLSIEEELIGRNSQLKEQLLWNTKARAKPTKVKISSPN